ncbi:unnamed protein product [Coffea canephora]|uniref:Uncharacterized protein n=1 Tax=Coffea canephora TaxID=49390 RepID=A0A068U5F9_COFCA|nr:unnamed protein product [Coffea canephora]
MRPGGPGWGPGPGGPGWGAGGPGWGAGPGGPGGLGFFGGCAQGICTAITACLSCLCCCWLFQDCFGGPSGPGGPAPPF